MYSNLVFIAQFSFAIFLKNLTDIKITDCKYYAVNFFENHTLENFLCTILEHPNPACPFLHQISAE